MRSTCNSGLQVNHQMRGRIVLIDAIPDHPLVRGFSLSDASQPCPGLHTYVLVDDKRPWIVSRY